MTESWPRRLCIGALYILAGCVFVAANFGGILRHIAESAEASHLGVSGLLIEVSRAPKAVLGSSSAALDQWLTICFFGLWLYLGILVVLALVRRRFSIATFGLGGFIAGVFSLAILSWAGILIWDILRLAGWMYRIFRIVFEAIGSFLSWVIIHTWPVLAALAALALIVLLWKQYGPARLLIGIACAAVLYLLGPVFRGIWERVLLPIFRWIGRTLGTIFEWLALALGWVLKIVLAIAAAAMAVAFVLGILGSCGYILVDQLRTAWQVGRSRTGVLLGSFSLGTSLALILLVSAGKPDIPAGPLFQPSTQQPSDIRSHISARTKGRKVPMKKRKSRPAVPVFVPPPPPPIAATVDRSWRRTGWILGGFSLTRAFAVTLPSSVLAWAQTTFTTASAPIFDAAVLALALALSVFGASRGLLTRKEMPMSVTFYSRDLVCLAFLPILVILLVISASDSNQ